MDKPKTTYALTYEDKFCEEDIENRHLTINYVIEEDVVDAVVYHILRYNRLDKGLDIKDRKPIFLYLNTPGGSVTHGYALIDCITNSKTPVYTVNIGECYSMGFLIAISGHKRYTMPSATYLMHDGSNGAIGSTAKLKDQIEFETGQMEEYTKNHILTHTSINNDLYDAKYRVEWYMYPTEAKSHNIVDYIVGTDCDIDEIL